MDIVYMYMLLGQLINLLKTNIYVILQIIHHFLGPSPLNNNSNSVYLWNNDVVTKPKQGKNLLMSCILTLFWSSNVTC